MAGVTEREIAWLIETDADALFVPSAALVARTTAEPAVAGAVYKPVLLTEPPPLTTDQFTDAFCAPETAAENWI